MIIEGQTDTGFIAKRPRRKPSNSDVDTGGAELNNVGVGTCSAPGLPTSTLYLAFLQCFYELSGPCMLDFSQHGTDIETIYMQVKTYQRDCLTRLEMHKSDIKGPLV
jgi:hypothetical protein